MDMKEVVVIRDSVKAVLRDKHGNEKMIVNTGWRSHKCLTNVGFAAVAGLILVDVGGTAFDYIAIGTGTTGAVAADEALEAEVKRKAGTGTRVETDVANDTAQLVATFAAADTLSGIDNITEVGMLNAAADGDLLMRQTFTAIPCNWDTGDTLEMTVKVQVKQGA